MNAPDCAVQSQDAVTLRAADFFQRRRFWGWTDKDQAELDAWLGESDFHRVAYLRLESSVARLAESMTFHAPMRALPPERGKRRSFVLPLLAAASILLALVFGIAYFRTVVQPADRVFATNVGGRALLKFADGTDVELNTSTAVRYRMTSNERTVWLDRGEAFFHVAHNAAHPFSVIADGHRVVDLGTEFLVRETGNLDVALLKGRAKLISENSSTPAAVLVPGEEAIATTSATTITMKTPQELADELAWRRGMLVFRNTRLVDAVREFNRYNETKLVIADPTIEDLKFTAEVSANNYEGFLKLAEIALNLRVDREGNDILIFRDQKAKRTVRTKHGS